MIFAMREEDLVVLCSKIKPFQSKLQRKWVQGLGAEQRAAAFMKDASAANKHSTSPPLEDKGEEDEDEEENGDEDADADEDEDSDEEDKEVHGGALPEWWRCNSGNLPHFAFVLRALLTNAPNSCPPERLFSMFNATFGEDQKVPSGGTTLSWQCSRSTTNAISELLLFWVCVWCDEIYI